MSFDGLDDQEINQGTRNGEYSIQFGISSGIQKKRSTTGCITCKLRKKRCDEIRPTCGDCKRLARRCEYIKDDMSEEEVKKLMDEMALIEKNSKTRIRKKKFEIDTEEPKLKKTTVFNPLSSKKSYKEKKKNTRRRSSSSSSKVVFNPLLIGLGSINASGSHIPGMGQTVINESTSPFPAFPIDTPRIDSILKNEKYEMPNNGGYTFSEKTSNIEGVSTSELTDNKQGVAELLKDGTTMNQNQHFHVSGNDYDKFNTINLSPGFTSFTTPNFHNENYNGDDNNNNNSIVPQSLNGEEFPTAFTEIFSEGFSKQLQEHFKSENLNTTTTPEVPSLSYKENEGLIESETRLVPLSEIGDMEHALIQYNQSSVSPKIYINPSAYTNSTLGNLTPIGRVLYDYYRDRLSSIASSAPQSENMYLNTFLSMAHVDRAVLYGIMAWSAFHLGGEALEKQGNYYIQLAVDKICERPLLDDENLRETRILCEEIDLNDEDIVKEPKFDDYYQNYEDMELSNLKRDNLINTRLAAFLILCGVEICRGDVSKWTRYLNYGAKLIKLKGGLERFNESKSEHFLVTNYAYHDITAIQVINEKTIHFDVEDYEKMWSASNELQFTDPLHGISAPVFKILAEANKLIINVQKLIRRTRKNEPIKKEGNVSDSPDSHKIYKLDETDYLHAFGDDVASVTSSIDENFFNGISSTVSEEWVVDDLDKDVLLEDYDDIMIQCQTLEEMIHKARPKLSPNFTNEELEMHMTMFECFQLTGRIHLRQSVLRMNAASLEIQYLTKQLIKVLDVLLGTHIESCLCFPMFIAGMCAITTKDRNEMNSRFRNFIKRYKWKNVLRCQIVIQYIWKLNYNGEKFVDWYAVVKKLGWDLSFA